MKNIYLSGPMAGLKFEVAEDWRMYAAARLIPGLRAVTPLRGKDEFRGKVLRPKNYAEVLNCDSHSITQRDRFDVMNADAMLVYMGDWEPASAGTLIEIGWADMHRVPIVLVTPSKAAKKAVEHPIVRGCAGWIVDDLNMGVEIINTLFV